VSILDAYVTDEKLPDRRHAAAVVFPFLPAHLCSFDERGFVLVDLVRLEHWAERLHEFLVRAERFVEDRLYFLKGGIVDAVGAELLYRCARELVPLAQL